MGGLGLEAHTPPERTFEDTGRQRGEKIILEVQTAEIRQAAEGVRLDQGEIVVEIQK